MKPDESPTEKNIYIWNLRRNCEIIYGVKNMLIELDSKMPFYLKISKASAYEEIIYNLVKKCFGKLCDP